MFDLLKSLFGNIFQTSAQAGLSGALMEQLQRLFRGESWYQSQLGNQLSGAQREANQFTHGLQIESQAFNSAEAAKQRQFQVDFYNQIQSPAAQVEAYKKAGLNPALLYGGISAPPAAGGTSASAGASSSVGASAGASLMNLADLALQKERLDIDKILARSESAYKDSQTALNNIDIQFRALEKEYGIAESQARISAAYTSIKKQLSDIDVNNSTIEVNGQRIEVLGSEVKRNEAAVALDVARTALANLDAQKAQVLLPYVEEYQRAEIALKYAQSSAARASAQASLAQARLAGLNAFKEQGLIDNGYYETMSKQATRDYKWTPINNVFNLVGKIAGAAVGFAAGSSVIGKAAQTARAYSAPTVEAILNGSASPGVPFN